MCLMVVTLSSCLTSRMRKPTRFNYMDGRRGTENEQSLEWPEKMALYCAFQFCEFPVLDERSLSQCNDHQLWPGSHELRHRREHPP